MVLTCSWDERHLTHMDFLVANSLGNRQHRKPRRGGMITLRGILGKQVMGITNRWNWLRFFFFCGGIRY
jgi:hypothetical protein